MITPAEALSTVQAHYQGKSHVTGPITVIEIDETARIAVVPVMWPSDAHDNGDYRPRNHWHVIDLDGGGMMMATDSIASAYLDQWQAFRAGAKTWGRTLNKDNAGAASDDYIAGFNNTNELY